MPYRQIDQSGVLFTAFRFGCPVIASDVGAFKDYIPEFAGLLIPQLTPSAIAETVREFGLQQHRFNRAKIRDYACLKAWPRTVIPLIEAYQMTRRACGPT
jgi:glycosyltransferase involved in cell wall biosynthesis